MFTPAQIHHRSICKVSDTCCVPDSFGLLCWNIHKKNISDTKFLPYLESSYADQADFLLFQEAVFEDPDIFLPEGFGYDAAANLEKTYHYGVMTAGRVLSCRAKALLTKEKEGVWGTHKSLLFTEYRFADGTPLMIVNIHAINFRENEAYRREKRRLFTYLSDYKGALIVAGDFNTWNPVRLRTLLAHAESLNMCQVPCAHEVKSFLGYPLDLIFYRGLELKVCEVDKHHAISDHHPVFVRFTKIL
jgi:endonuclease/exonuclease/phosphatase (EEP) superfamily protein YafD